MTLLTPDLLRRSFRVTCDPMKINMAIGLYPASTMSLLHVFYGKNLPFSNYDRTKDIGGGK